MMITKYVSINYTSLGKTFTFRGWLFWHWRILTEHICPSWKGYSAGIRILGISIQGARRRGA